MIGTIVTPMARGQITIPKEYRDKLGITPDTPLNVTLEEDRIVVKPLNRMMADTRDRSSYVIKPKYSKEEKKRILQNITQYMKKHGPLWTEEDDKAREIMRKKEKFWDW